MQAPKSKSLQSEATPDVVLAALLGVVQNGKFTLLGVNNEYRKMVFTSGMTGLSWGQEYVAEVNGSGGAATLSLVCGGRDGAPKALLDGWKNGKAADKVIAAVQGVLAGTGASGQPVESFATREDGSTAPWTGPDYPA